MSNGSQCTTCGTHLSVSASFCPSCGQSISHDHPSLHLQKSQDTKILRRVGILSSAKVMSIVIGLLAMPFLGIGILFSLFSGDPMAATLTVAITLSYVVIYFAVVLIGTWLFNIALRWTGRIDIELN